MNLNLNLKIKKKINGSNPDCDQQTAELETHEVAHFKFIIQFCSILGLIRCNHLICVIFRKNKCFSFIPTFALASEIFRLNFNTGLLWEYNRGCTSASIVHF